MSAKVLKAGCVCLLQQEMAGLVESGKADKGEAGRARSCGKRQNLTIID